jgi:hypothetical protein
MLIFFITIDKLKWKWFFRSGKWENIKLADLDYLRCLSKFTLIQSVCNKTEEEKTND